MVFLGIDVGGSSVKAAAVKDGVVLWTGQSAKYSDPSADRLADAIRQAVGGRLSSPAAVGLCVPGILADDRESIALSVNIPKLNGFPLRQLVAESLGTTPPNVRVLNDSTAAAYDIYLGRKLAGRLFLMVLGTGVGVTVIDENGPLSVDGDSPGHFGQMDVSIEGHPVIGPDGGAGSLEGYVGAAALKAAYGNADPAAAIRVDHPTGRALVRALRIAHALYRPDHIALAGGVGVRLGHLLPALKSAVETNLTSVAKRHWTLSVGQGDFHAAVGAARAAGLR
jgi:predicted NBD/HSP70 family sugar kinase